MASHPDQYASVYPTDVVYDPAIVSFVATFYEVVDTASDDPKKFADLFNDDGILQVGSWFNAKGQAELLKTHEQMWAHVARRLHKVEKVFPFGGSTELMLYGWAQMWTKESEGGVESMVDFSGHMQLDKDQNGKLRISEYRCHLTPRTK